MSVTSTQVVTNNVIVPEGIGSSMESGVSQHDSVSPSDSSWFSFAIQPSIENKEPQNVADKIVSQLSGSSEHLQKLEEKANRAVKKAGVTGNPMDVTAANRSLSSFYLESLLTTKLVSKGAQTIEKLTSLQ